MEIDFKNVLDKEPFNEETSEELFDNTGWISLSEYNADRVKKLVFQNPCAKLLC